MLPPLMKGVMEAAASCDPASGPPRLDTVLRGWVTTVRRQKRVAFASLRDGSYPAGVQVVAEPSMLAGVQTGACVAVRGTLVPSPASGQDFEMQAESVELLGSCDAEQYPLQKQDQT